jgi:hypothetical protein
MIGKPAVQIKPASSANGGIKQDVPEGDDVRHVIAPLFAADADQPVEKPMLPGFADPWLRPIRRSVWNGSCGTLGEPAGIRNVLVDFDPRYDIRWL